MSVVEILQQVKSLSFDERKELMKHLIDTLETHP